MIRFEAHTYENAASPRAIAWHELAAMQPRSPIRSSISLSMKQLHGFSLLEAVPFVLRSKNISLEAVSDISFVKANLGSWKMLEDVRMKDSVGPV